MKYIFFAAAIILFASCSKEVDTNTMSKVYIDILVAKETFPKGSDTLKAVKNNIFETYEISGEQYYSTLKSFETDQEKWEEFFEKSRIYLDSLKIENKSN